MTLGRESKTDPNIRDVDADYKAAYIAEYEAYVRVGRDEEAAAVADILRDAYKHEVETGERAKRPYNRRQQAPERADAKPAPEKVVPVKPEHTKAD